MRFCVSSGGGLPILRRTPLCCSTLYGAFSPWALFCRVGTVVSCHSKAPAVIIPSSTPVNISHGDHPRRASSQAPAAMNTTSGHAIEKPYWAVSASALANPLSFIVAPRSVAYPKCQFSGHNGALYHRAPPPATFSSKCSAKP